MPVTGQHEPILVALSVLIALVAAYTALDLSTRLKAARGWTYVGWLMAASAALGGGIWSMHFVGMLGLHLPVRTDFSPWLVALSFLLPIVATACAFAIADGRTLGDRWSFWLAGLLMGGAIVAMHYTGMTAMSFEGSVENHPGFVAAATVIAVAASLAAIHLAGRPHSTGMKLAASAILATAVSGMHYTGIAGATFMCRAAVETEIVQQTNLALMVTLATFALLALGSVASVVDRRSANSAAREAEVLRKSEERYRLLYQRTPLPLHSLDGAGRIEQVSDAWLAMLGYERPQVLGRSLTDFMTPQSERARLDHDWEDIKAGRPVPEREFQFHHSSGRVIDVLLTASWERSADGEFVRSVEGLVDVTDRKLADAALRQAQKMEAVGQLTGGIAHDFNNVLMVVGGGLGMIERGKQDPRIVEGMKNAVDRASTLTKQLLAFSRKRAGKPEVVDLAQRLPSLREMVSHSLPPTVDLTFDVEAGAWPAEIDAGEMELAILNLVVNAKDAMPDGGAMRVDARNEVLDGRNAAGLKGEFVAVRVSDEGHGMSQETMARVFEPFFTTKAHGRGTGLGLSQVYGFARNAGGGVAIRSAPGAGAAFTIYLPRTDKEVPIPEAEESSAPEAVEDRGLVMLVEDTPSVATVLTGMLHELGYDVVQAADAAEALVRLEETGGITAVVSDVVMPGQMDGVALAREIRRRRPKMPILLSTGYSREADGIEEFRVLRKPFAADEFDRTLGDVIAGRDGYARAHGEFRRPAAAGA